MQFVALDFETANAYSDSACALGLCRMDEDGRTLDSWYSLICPKIAYFDPYCTSVHHLQSADLKAAPRFDVLWPDIRKFLGNDFIVAHNAAFDMKVLKDTLSAYALDVPPLLYICSLTLARHVWKGRKHYSLQALASGMEIEYQAHNAAEDAYVAARLFVRLCGEHLFEEVSFRAFLAEQKLQFSVLQP